jgi:pre-mRNA-splicing factor SYF1
MQVTANQEDIELPEESDSEDDEKVEIAQKDVPSAVFGGLAGKREEPEKDDAKDGGSRLGALERIKRLKRGG